ncbi:hypothetical protein QYE76_008253 [Lolium multiflorum]|uniref:Uncharacterized protein n=1 Tax=Lolium multiflorum TaxID=4521 RepID=A0AAD8VFJ0_LOLMU|nr:hypothetical protein QYE76_008253 [Lolium multiflorum]
MENYSLLMGAAAVMEMAVEMAAVSMEKPWGHFPAPAGWEQTLSPDLGFAMAAAGRREMNHIATGTAPSLDGELIPPHGSSSGDEDGGGDGSGVDGEAFRGHFPLRRVPEQRLLSPDLGFAMVAALEGSYFAHEASEEGDGSGATRWRHNRGGGSTAVPWCVGLVAFSCPSACQSLRRETPGTESHDTETFPARAAIPISGDSEITSGTLPEGESSPGGLFTAMVASGVMSE